MDRFSKAVVVAGVVAIALGSAEPTGAQTNSGVPTGALMMFDGASCPAGWTEFAQTRGRAIIGLPQSPYATPPANLTTRGTAIIGPDPAHGHNVSLLPTIAPAGGHSHTTKAGDDRTEGVTGGFGKASNPLHTHVTSFVYDHSHKSSVKGSTGSAPLSSILPYVFVRICRKN
jgi:hypothetical protein